VRLLVPGLYPLLLGLLAVAAFGAVYFALTAALGIGEAAAFLGRFRRVLGRR
jgi:hypothetical protein